MSGDKKDKKDKKQKEESKKEKVEEPVEEEKEEATIRGDYQERLFVSPIATPLAEDKLSKKLLKLIKKGMQDKLVRRGVKETVKAIRKGAKGLCIIAADISPIDVLSHLPVLCEEKGIPYVFVKSRAEVGEACKTKRPTSCVLIASPEKAKHEASYSDFKECKEKVTEVNPYL